MSIPSANPNTWDNETSGNYWTDYTTVYPQANSSAAGVGDTAFWINDVNVDHYPLLEPFDISNPGLLPLPVPTTNPSPLPSATTSPTPTTSPFVTQPAESPSPSPTVPEMPMKPQSSPSWWLLA